MKNYQSGEQRTGDVVAEYDYLTEDGQPFMRVVRTSEKKFPLMKWDGNKWQWGAPSGRLPYNLPDVLEAEEIFICEGEKDADSVTALGLCATTNAGGAGKWTKELNCWFNKHQKIYILEDNDEPGRDHAELVARNLVNCVGEVHILSLPGLKEKGDVSDWLATGNTKKKLLIAAANAELYVKQFVEIIFSEDEISRVIDETQAAMIRKNRPIFVRAGMLVEPLWTKYQIRDDVQIKQTVFRPIPAEGLMYMINKHGIVYKKWMKSGKNVELKEIGPPMKVMTSMLSLGHWQFPTVSGIIYAPTMRPDGTILVESGYDESTQLWHQPPEFLMTMNKVPAKPDRADAERCLTLLNDLLVEFAFPSQLDRAVALAAMLTVIMRGAFDIAPMVLFVANMPGTGKSYLVDLISMIVRGQPCPVIAASRNEEEMEKRIGALLIESAPIISFDNISFDLKNDTLCQMCTQSTVKVRILGKSETHNCTWKGALFATGNNVSLAGDMTRRGLICNMDANTEHPELRSFKYRPIEKVINDRGSYIAAALTLVRAYLLSGENVDVPEIGSYGGWSRFVREPLIWLGEEDPVKSMEQARRNDPGKEAAELLFEQWRVHLGVNKPYKISEVIECAKEAVQAQNFGVGAPDFERIRPDFFDLLVERAGERNNIDPRKFGMWLKELKNQIFSGFKLVTHTESRAHGHRWMIVPKGGFGG